MSLKRLHQTKTIKIYSAKTLISIDLPLIDGVYFPDIG